MLKSEMQHQFWITKKTVQRKLGSKEDEHVISSDAELDAKIEAFKSISETSCVLNKLIDQLQEQLCILSQEECVFGRFLKEAGKRSKTTGTSIANTGKAVSYSGQQRMCVRVPMLRLQHEVEVFRYRAVRDTLETIQGMEKDRTEYRAALAWMKAASAELDPDTGRGLDKFRVAQSVVRNAKQNFDSSALNSKQKIDLLAAARCNMFSHALSTYLTEMKEFGKRTSSTYESISCALEQKPKYDFTVLKELTHNEGVNKKNKTESNEKTTNGGQKSPFKDKQNKIVMDTKDKDQCIFFADEFKDNAEHDDKYTKDHKKQNNDMEIFSLQVNDNDGTKNESIKDNIIGLTEAEEDGLLLLPMNNQSESNMHLNGNSNNNNNNHNNNNNNETMLENNWWKILHNNQQTQGGGGGRGEGGQQEGQPIMMMSSMKPQLNQQSTLLDNQEKQQKLSVTKNNKGKKINKNNSAKYNSWLDMFAEIDPLANPEAFDLKLHGSNKNIQQA